MADELDDEERALLEKHRKAKRAERDKADDDRRAVLWHSDGSGAEVPYSKAKKWLQGKFGIDLDDEPVQDVGEDEKPADDEEPAKVRPAHFGRRSG